MVDIVLFLAGVALVAFAFFDFIKTTLGTAGAGPMTRAIARRIWAVAARLVPTLRRRLSRDFEDAVGPLILSGVALAWIALHCAGYTLMLWPDGALLDAGDGTPASAVARLAFAGSALSTLGASLSEPGGPWWDVLSMLAAVNGMVVLTLTVSFVMTVRGAITFGRSLALQVSALAERSEALGPEAYRDALETLGPDFVQLAMLLRSAPLARYFATPDARMNLPAALVIVCRELDREGTARADGTERPGLLALRSAIAEIGASEAVEGDRGVDATHRWAERHRL